MKYLDEYRDATAAKQLADDIAKIAKRDWTIMEVCGGQTHAIVKYGLDQMLPPNVHLVHGPGCPVCVTPVELVDKALQIASRGLTPSHSPASESLPPSPPPPEGGTKKVIFCSFGDMLRVPGTKGDLFSVKSRGGDVRTVYSPLDAVRIAEENPDREVVFFAVGFETTAPVNALSVLQAKQKGLKNYSVLVSHVLVPPAIEAVLSSPNCKVQGFLAAGHVCTVMGYEEYLPLSEKYGIPIVVTGFEPLDILHGIHMVVKQLEEGRHEVENQYTRSVTRAGNTAAQKLVSQIFRVVPRKWRGIGEIPFSGLALTEDYAQFDAERKFGVANYTADENPDCLSGLVLQGLKKPKECPLFGTICTPENPLGATMVSNEGACAAYYRYRRTEPDA